MIIIGIAGGSGSGKTTVVSKILKQLPKDSVSVISQDSYYRDNGHLSAEEKKKINFDHPASIEFNLLNKHIDLLKSDSIVQMPVYDYISCGRGEESIQLVPKKVIIIEGILIFTNKALRDRMDIKVFVDAEPDDRLTRIIRRDIEQRGRDFKEVLVHYEKYVKPMHYQFIEPTKRYADIIIPQGGENKVAIDVLSSMVKLKLNH